MTCLLPIWGMSVSLETSFCEFSQWMQLNKKATQTFKCWVSPLANDFGGRCETGKSLNFLWGNGAAEVSYFQERRVDLCGSIFNFPV